MDIEKLIADYFDYSALKEAPEQLFRIHVSGDRFYYRYKEDGKPKFYPSITTVIKNTTPTSPHLIKWMCDMGYEESKEYTQKRAWYGSFLHAEIARLMIDKIIDLDTMDERLLSFMENNRIGEGFLANLNELKKDLLAFGQFVRDYNVNPLAVEIAVHSKKGFACQIDMPCTMDIEEKGYWGETYKSGVKKGLPKETKKKRTVTAIVDFKSGRKGFFPEHQLQLVGCKTAWEENFPEHPIDKLYNWAPSEWISKPSYKLKEQTSKKAALKLEYLLGISSIDTEDKTRNVRVISGVLDLKKDMSENVQVFDLVEKLSKPKRRKRVKNYKQKKRKDNPTSKSRQSQDREEIGERLPNVCRLVYSNRKVHKALHRSVWGKTSNDSNTVHKRRLKPSVLRKVRVQRQSGKTSSVGRRREFSSMEYRARKVC